LEEATDSARQLLAKSVFHFKDIAKGRQIAESIEAMFPEFFSGKAQGLDGCFSAIAFVDREGLLVHEEYVNLGIILGRIEKERLLLLETPRGVSAAPRIVKQREVILLVPLIAELTCKKEVGPLVGEPEIPRPLERAV